MACAGGLGKREERLPWKHKPSIDRMSLSRALGMIVVVALLLSAGGLFVRHHISSVRA
jgi:hypothetical protein